MILNAELRDAAEAELARQHIWERFGAEGAVFISDMASFSSVSRKVGVCHFLKLIYRARQIIAPLIAKNNGKLLKCDADNCYAFFESIDEDGRVIDEVATIEPDRLSSRLTPLEREISKMATTLADVAKKHPAS